MENLAFICHSRADAELSNKIVVELEKAGIPAWIAPRNIRLGTTYAAAIIQAIRRSSYVIFVFSKASNNSDHVVNEIENAHSLKKPIIPFKIDDGDYSDSLDYYLRSKQSINAYDRSLERAISELINAIGDSVPVPPPPSSRKTLPVKKGAIISVIVILLVVIAGFMILNKPKRGRTPADEGSKKFGPDAVVKTESAEPDPQIDARTRIDFLTGNWQLEWGTSEGKGLESARISNDGKYFVNDAAAFEITGYQYDPGSQQITFTKRSLIDTRVLLNSVTVQDDNLLVGTESNYGVTYRRVSR